MAEKTFGVMTFESTSYAIKAEKVFKEENIEIKTIPTPREISLSCGLSIRFDLENLNLVKNIIEVKNLEINKLYKMVKEGLKYSIEEIS